MESENTTKDINLKKVSNYLNGNIDIGNTAEVDRLNTLLTNHKKAGNAFLHMSIYRLIKRVSHLMDVTDLVEEKLYNRTNIDKMSNQNLYDSITQLNKSIDLALTQIQDICNNNKLNASIVNNILFNYTPVEQVVNDQVLDKTERDKIREGVTLLLNEIKNEKG